MLVLPFIRYFMSREVRQRFLVHSGTNRECAIDLLDYGIPTKYLPVSMGGDYQLDHFLEWFGGRQKLELERENELFGLQEGLDLGGLDFDQQILPIEP